MYRQDHAGHICRRLKKLIALADMLAHHKSELICDLAEYYNILDYRRVPGRTLGTLAVGLRAESRIGSIREGIKATPEVMVLARIYDILAQVFSDEHEKPKSLYKTFLIKQKEDKDTPAVFRSGEDFKAAWNKR